MRTLFGLILITSLSAFAQTEVPKPEPQPSADKPAQGPPIKYNYLNVCNPSEAEKQEITAALDRVPKKANFSQDFEVTRGRSSMQDAPSARYIRLRRELSGDPLFSAVQYSLSTDAEDTIETLVLKVKEPKELFSISLEDQVSAAASAPASVLDVNTPVSRIKLERFGKSNLVLARCPGADQSTYEPLFQQATALLAGYRKSLGLHGMFRTDIAWLSPAKSKSTAAKTKPPATSTSAAPK
ncbi:MAG TPA: hypothetical protein VM056_06210 [Terriglobales bacterium]|nr:hypothetical protein [Terriglobales bacterium]